MTPPSAITRRPPHLNWEDHDSFPPHSYGEVARRAGGVRNPHELHEVHEDWVRVQMGQAFQAIPHEALFFFCKSSRGSRASRGLGSGAAGPAFQANARERCFLFKRSGRTSGKVRQRRTPGETHMIGSRRAFAVIALWL